MIKTSFLILAFIVPIALFSQEKPVIPVEAKTGLITYQEVVQVNGTQDELYIRAIEWMNTFYKNPSDVSRVRNRESGVIEILHRIEISKQEGEAKVLTGIINYTLSIEFKPGRYRYVIDELTLRQASRFPIERWLNKADPAYTPEWDKYLEQVDIQIKEVISSLKQQMEPKTVAPEEKW